jgi:hypothetical protein
MCEFLDFLFTFLLGAITGGLCMYYRLLADIKAFEEEYEPVLLLLKQRNEI